MPAPYCLAIDIGTSRTAAAIARSTPGGVVAASVPLGRASDNAPTAVFVGDGGLLFGDAAERRGASSPGRLIREFKRRIGDDVPILAGDRAFAPEELYALAVDWAARIVMEREGQAPERLALTVPAAWGHYRSEIVRAALAAEGWRDVDIVSEPVAAARHYETTHPLPAGHCLAVYDFGGGTFDAVVLRKDDAGEVHLVGLPAGIADLGGADFDDAVVRHIVAAAQVDATALAGETAGRMALAALRRECVEAKESLSFDSEAVIPVILSGDQRTVRLTRDELELMIAADLERTADVLDDALAAAGVASGELDAILLTGGSSRIPRVAQVISERFDRPIAIDADPKAVIALGAARASATVPAPTEVEQSADDAELETLLTAGDVRRTRRKSWFRRVPATAYLAGLFAIALTGAALAAAPTLGRGAPGAVEAAALGATASPGRTPAISLFEPPVFEAAPVIKTFDDRAPTDPEQPARGGAVSPSAPVSGASATTPDATAAEAKPRGGSDSPAAEPERAASALAPERGEPNPATAAPDHGAPEPTTPGPVTPEPQQTPDPVVPATEPEPGATDPEQPAADPGDTGQEPAPPVQTAPDPTAAEI